MMSDEDTGSVTRWIDRLKAGQPEAADALWRRYYEQVVAEARRHLQGVPHQAVEDAEDVAADAMHRLWAGATQGRFERLSDRVDLWQLLVAITVKNAISVRRRYASLKRGGSLLRGGSAVEETGNSAQDDADALALAVSKEPTPESAAIIQEQLQQLLDSLGDPILRQIALWRMDGLSNAEIAEKMGCVVRTVERKLERIRLIWAEIGLAPDE
jgi:RNA polymerase sigma factor (sigma-70 family)